MLKSLMVSVMCLGAFSAFCAELPEPKTGGPGKAPMSLLILIGDRAMDGDAALDPQYEKQLTDAGYRVVKASLLSRLSPEYLRQFGAVILTKLPHAGAQYSPNGQKLVHVDENLGLIQEYVANGGGVLVEPAISEFGEAFADTYNRFLKPFDATLVAQQLRQDSETKGAYAAGVINSPHPIAAGLKNILYPINVLRWDHAYSTTPCVLSKEWTVLASGKSGSGTHQALDNSMVGPQLTTNMMLFAIRPYKKGMVALSAIHSYYTLTQVFYQKDSIGENHTGVIDGIPMFGEKDGRPSDLAKLLDRTYRFLVVNSAKNGIGGGAVELPPQDPAPVCTPVIDWHTAKPPPTWQHRVTGTPLGDGKTTYWDEMPDPLVQGKIVYFKALVGARTALGGGRGTVRQYREAAIKAGYSAIMFAEPLEQIDPQKWGYFVQDCRDNTDDQFVCLPGLNITDFQGGRYLVLGPERFPDPGWLTEDGKKLKAVRMLSLGWYGQLSSVHRAGRIPLHPKMLKQYTGITVYTYDGKGKLVDDALHAYQWAVRSDSNPFPITAHEVNSPDEVALAATTGYQQILPAPSLKQAVEYFRFGLPNYFQCPGRYFISEGPNLDGWSIFNKDIGKAEENRDHYRLGIGVTGEEPITEATLYDGFEVAGRWNPGAKEFRAVVDGFHDRQHEYLLLATDSKGRRVLSSGIRTVCKNWRCRCGDRQNWLGSYWIYTGTDLGALGNYSLPFRNTREGSTGWLGTGGGNPCPILDFPYFSNHLKVEEADIATKYIDAGFEDVAYDAKPIYAVRPTDFTDGTVRMWNFVPRPNVRLQGYDQFFNVALMEVSIRLKRDVEPAPNKAVWPEIAGAMAKNELLLLPGQPPATLPVKETLDLPVGSYVGGIIPLTPGLQLAGKTIGFPAPSPDVLNAYEGTTWKASYLVLKNSSFQYCTGRTGFETDTFAARALKEMGFDGKPPYVFDLQQGKFEKLAYIVDFTSANGGIAGTCRNEPGQALLYDVPLRLSGLNPRCAAAVWRADAKVLDYFACYQGTGYVTLNADKTVEFYAGNVAQCDPALFVSVVIWNGQEAWFRLNNPTKRDITTEFATVSAIKGFKPLKQTITVKAGSSLDVGDLPR